MDQSGSFILQMTSGKWQRWGRWGSFLSLTPAQSDFNNVERLRPFTPTDDSSLSILTLSGLQEELVPLTQSPTPTLVWQTQVFHWPTANSSRSGSVQQQVRNNRNHKRHGLPEKDSSLYAIKRTCFTRFYNPNFFTIYFFFSTLNECMHTVQYKQSPGSNWGGVPLTADYIFCSDFW